MLSYEWQFWKILIKYLTKTRNICFCWETWSRSTMVILFNVEDPLHNNEPLGIRRISRTWRKLTNKYKKEKSRASRKERKIIFVERNTGLKVYSLYYTKICCEIKNFIVSALLECWKESLILNQTSIMKSQE